MNISAISFSSGSTFQDLISKPQAYAGAPVASSKMDVYQGQKPKKKHTLLKVLGFAAAVAALLALGYKKGGFDAIANKCNNETVNNITKHLNTAGEFVAKKAVQAKDYVVNFASNLGKKNNSNVINVEPQKLLAAAPEVVQ